MIVYVEFYGIPRSRAGVAATTVAGATLGEVLSELGQQFGEFKSECLVGDSLADGYMANLNGKRFVRIPTTPIADGDSLLILSSDAGG